MKGLNKVMVLISFFGVILTLLLPSAVQSGERSVALLSLSDPLVNLVQWPADQGGNDHWYGVITSQLYWEEAVVAAGAYSHESLTGYLGTVTSTGENDFILNNVLLGLAPDTIDQYWLGGFDSGSNYWGWLTGEYLGYTNWAPGEPNSLGIETALTIYGWNNDHDIRPPGTWNNTLPNDDINDLHRWWALVEFGEPIWDTIGPDLVNLIQWPVDDGGNDHWYGVIPQAMFWEDAVPLAATYVLDDFEGRLATITSEEENNFILNYVLLGLIPEALIDQYWLLGTDIAVNEWVWLNEEPFLFTNWAPGEPSNLGVETALTIFGWGETNPQRPAGFWNNTLPNDDINDLHQWWALVELECRYLGGDVNGDADGPNMADLVYLVAFMFDGGAEPPISGAANVDGLGEINIADLVFLVDYMFLGGPMPVGCP